MMNLDDVSARCAENHRLFLRGDDYDPQYCFELFRRACNDGDQQAREAVHAQYGPLVAGWIERHPRIAETEGDVQRYVELTFDRLWVGLSSGGFDHFRSLLPVLQYLKMCTHVAVVGDLRRTK